MKSYNQFVYESYSARENIQEAIPLVVAGALKLGSMGLTAWQAYQAAQKLQKGDYKGAALDAALAIPSARLAGWGGKALQLGTKGTQVLKHGTRLAKVGAYTKMGVDELGQEQGDTSSQGDTSPQNSAGDSGSTTPPSSTTPSSSTTSQPKSTKVLAKKGGKEGVLDKATGKWTEKQWGEAGRTRYQEKRGSEQLKKDAEKVKTAPTTAPNRRQQIDATVSQIKKAQDQGRIKNPFQPSTTTSRPTTTRPTTPTPSAPTRPPGGVVADKTPTQTTKKSTPVVKRPEQRFDIRDRDIRARSSFDPRYDRR